jgi:hypothetical protein
MANSQIVRMLSSENGQWIDVMLGRKEWKGSSVAKGMDLTIIGAIVRFFRSLFGARLVQMSW